MGLIPACAGKTLRIAFRRGRGWAHPRVCGENETRPRTRGGGAGSSPRVRGKPVFWPPAVRSHRLIPACAGKTGRNTESCCAARAHPRVCGENARVPRGPKTCAWLIPACAGKTCFFGLPTLCGTAHPRVCGENDIAVGDLGEVLGSSPRVRGKRTPGALSPAGTGLIPACAGKTTSTSTATQTRVAHPRVCGENSLSPALSKPPSGSSPRVRGKLLGL